MNPVRLRDDCAWKAAQELLKTVAPALREKEHSDFFVEALRICQNLLESYDIKREREAMRLGRCLQGECHVDGEAGSTEDGRV